MGLKLMRRRQKGIEPVVDFVAQGSSKEDEQPKLDQDEGHCSNKCDVHPRCEKEMQQVALRSC